MSRQKSSDIGRVAVGGCVHGGVTLFLEIFEYIVQVVNCLKKLIFILESMAQRLSSKIISSIEWFWFRVPWQNSNFFLNLIEQGINFPGILFTGFGGIFKIKCLLFLNVTYPVSIFHLFEPIPVCLMSMTCLIDHVFELFRSRSQRSAETLHSSRAEQDTCIERLFIFIFAFDM